MVASPRLGRVESQDPEGEGIPAAPSSEGDPPSGQEGIPPPFPAAGLQPGPRPMPHPLTAPPTFLVAPSPAPRPQFTTPPSIHPSRRPRHALLPGVPRPPPAFAPGPALPVASPPPTAAALLRTRDPSRARHLGGLSPSFMGRWPLAVGASESAGVRPAQRFQGGCKGQES